MATMQSVYHQTSTDVSQRPSVDSIASGGRRLLQAVFWVSRDWVEHLPVDDPQRKNLIYLGILADDLVRAGDYSPNAMTTAQALLCVNCRRLNAAQGQCTGQPLDRCRLLEKASQ
jgi:hypothetical protein